MQILKQNQSEKMVARQQDINQKEFLLVGVDPANWQVIMCISQYIYNLLIHTQAESWWQCPTPHYSISIQLSEFIYLDAWLIATVLIILPKLLIIVLVEITCRVYSGLWLVFQLACHQC